MAIANPKTTAQPVSQSASSFWPDLTNKWPDFIRSLRTPAPAKVTCIANAALASLSFFVCLSTHWARRETPNACLEQSPREVSQEAPALILTPSLALPFSPFPSRLVTQHRAQTRGHCPRAPAESDASIHSRTPIMEVQQPRNIVIVGRYACFLLPCASLSYLHEASAGPFEAYTHAHTHSLSVFPAPLISR